MTRGRKKGVLNHGTMEKKIQELTEALLLIGPVGQDLAGVSVQFHLNEAPKEELFSLVEAIRKRLPPDSWPALFKIVASQVTMRSAELLLEQYPDLVEEFGDFMRRIQVLKGQKKRRG